MRETTTTILLVEDNPADARFAEELLTGPIYTFIEAKSLAQALDCVKDKKIDVVLLDLSLPDSTGLETLATLVMQQKELPIVVLTGHEDIGFAIEALRAGANDYIVKNRLSTESLTRSISFAIETKKRQITEEWLLERTKLSNVTAAIGQAMVRESSIGAVLQACTDALIAHLEIPYSMIWTVDDRAKVLVLQATSGFEKAHDHSQHARIPFGKFRIGKIAEERRAHMVNTLHGDPLIDDPAWAKRERIVAFAGHPLLLGDRLLGVLAIFARKDFSDIALNALNSVADQLAVGIDRLRTEESRALLANIVEFSDDAIISENLYGEILSWNKGAEKIFGYKAQEVLGKKHFDSMLCDHGDERRDSLERLRAHLTVAPYEAVCLTKDGSRIVVSVAQSLIKDREGTVIGASQIIQDVTSKKKLEQFNFTQNEVARMLSVSGSITICASEMLELIAKSTDSDVASFWEFDRKSQRLQCLEVWHTPEKDMKDFVALTKHVSFPPGLTLPGRVLANGQTAWIPIIEQDAGFARKAPAQKAGLVSAAGFPILAGSKVLGLIELFSKVKKDYDVQLSHLMTNICSQLGQFLDRTYSQQLAKQAIQAQLHIAQAIMACAPIGIAWLDKDLMISEVNPAFCQQFNLDPHGLSGQYIFEVPTGIPNDRLLKVIQEGVPFSSPNLKVLSNNLAPEGAYYDLTIWPVKDDDEQVVGLVSLTVEVTERVKLTKQRDDFVATLTHDLKNPLIGQERVLEMLLAESLGHLEPELMRVLSVLKVGTRELLDLIGTLLQVYRFEGDYHLELESVDPSRLVASCIEQVRTLAETKRIELIYSVVPSKIPADPIALKRILMNLLDNAIRFSHEGSQITVSGWTTESDYLLAVQDKGTGISKDELKYLFQRFTQTPTGRKHSAGTGLGLYLCRQIAEAHNGRITCSSQEGIGTTFEVSIPLVSTQKPGN